MRTPPGPEEIQTAARKKSKVTPKFKTKYRVKNWAAYEAALRNRGDITFWLDEDARLSGRCTKMGDRCGVRDSAACRASLMCISHGRCALVGQACVVGSSDDCKRSTMCTDTKRYTTPNCHQVGNDCVYRPEDCRRSRACKTIGACARADNGIQCVVGGAGAAADRLGSTRCKLGRHCYLNAARTRCVKRVMGK